MAAGEDEVIEKVVREAGLRADTDPQVHAEIEMTYQILYKMMKLNDDHRDLILSAAAVAITLHEPMDGRPFF